MGCLAPAAGRCGGVAKTDRASAMRGASSQTAIPWNSAAPWPSIRSLLRVDHPAAPARSRRRAASCWSSRRNGSWSAGASSPRPPWPRSRSQKRPWSSPMVNLPRRRLEPSTELSQRLCRSKQNSSFAELLIQRSGLIVDEWSCTISLQAVIL